MGPKYIARTPLVCHLYIIRPKKRTTARNRYLYMAVHTSWIDSVHQPYATSMKYTVDAHATVAVQTKPKRFHNRLRGLSFPRSYQNRAFCGTALSNSFLETKYLNLPGWCDRHKDIREQKMEDRFATNQRWERRRCQ